MEKRARARLVVVVAAALLLGCAGQRVQQQEPKQETRETTRMAQREAMTTDLARTTVSRPGIRDERVLAAVAAVQRHRFVPPDVAPRAYGDHPLPIGHGQTISQPWIVARMTELLRPARDDVVLEVGTGSGYQAAVLAELVRHVYTIEIVEPLAAGAAAALSSAGYTNVTVRAGDGYQGWPEHAPFDGIVVTAAPDHVPEPLVEQLAEGGRLVLPIGPAWGIQTLRTYEKVGDSLVLIDSVLVRFVPLTGEHGSE